MQRRNSRWYACLLGVLLAGASARTAAAMSCSIVSTTGVSFGGYDPTRNGPLDSTGAIVFRCDDLAGGGTVMIELSRGDSGAFLPRAMINRKFHLEYNLFLDAARTVVWGDGTAGTSTYVARPSDGQVISVPIFGRIPPRQNVKPETYGDVIIVTLQY